MSIEPALPAPHVPRLLEVHEVAYLLKCSHETVLRLIRKQKLIAVRLTDRSWRVKATDYDAFVEARRTVNGNGNGNGHHPPDDGAEA